MSKKTTVILGAGFSKNSGVPVQTEFSNYLVESYAIGDFDKAVSKIIKRYIKNVFGYSKGNAYPQLDDILTSIDIAINSGHNLGAGYSYTHLELIRKVIVYRIISILEGFYRYSRHAAKFVRVLLRDYPEVDFVVLNWDTVLEKNIYEMEEPIGIDYVNGGEEIKGLGNSLKISKVVKVLKVHGSCNWMYCNNCRVLINDLKSSISPLKRTGFTRMDILLLKDLEGVDINYDNIENKKCFRCGNVLSSHIATQSYRNSFKVNSFSNIWAEAEKSLSLSDKWIFVGYSLPQNDYEFKHLLKIAELKLSHKKKTKLNIDVVLLNSDSTAVRYKSFFGDKINMVCNEGIEEYLNYL
ncbi:hypothetical protein [Acetivibrio saccincola]|uniref:Uncharacterized protein n=1 Tax=Acetivibrio saccincola TaxID=1677857 RepID=A0A2K9E0R4_9FIRM|nr:hypothetical protein [Acetivibrio saccincola]AUG57367.1 hypothetical protein HVS_07250 [Acetivibrio saccincola]HOA96884.1 hypothetical protein [Acetivibrio saccincola]